MYGGLSLKISDTANKIMNQSFFFNGSPLNYRAASLLCNFAAIG